MTSIEGTEKLLFISVFELRKITKGELKMNNEVKEPAIVDEIIKSFFEEFKSIVKGKVYIKWNDNDDKVIDISIINHKLRWTSCIKLQPGSKDIILNDKDRAYVKTLVVMKYEEYRRYVLDRFFVHEV